MILLSILILVLLMLLTITVLAVSIGGTAFIVIFGDVIVCIFIIGWIIARIIKRKRR